MTVVMQPHFTEVQVLAPYALVREDLKRVTLDLRGKLWADLKIAVGGGGTTAVNPGVNVRVYRNLAGDAAGHPRYATPYWSGRTRTAMGARQINNAGGYAAGIWPTVYAFDGAGGTAPAVGDRLIFWGVDTIPAASGAVTPDEGNGVEVLTLSKGTSTPATFDTPPNYARIDNEWFCQADSWELRIPGGALLSLVIDYGRQSAGDPVLCLCDALVADYYEPVTI